MANYRMMRPSKGHKGLCIPCEIDTRLTIVDTRRRPLGLPSSKIAIGVQMKYPYDFILAAAFFLGALFCIVTLAAG